MELDVPGSVSMMILFGAMFSNIPKSPSINVPAALLSTDDFARNYIYEQKIFEQRKLFPREHKASDGIYVGVRKPLL
jgi:hypothetical protein